MATAVKKTHLAPPPRPGRFDRKELLFLGALILLGLGLRLYALGQESLWLDEGYTLYTAQQGSFLDLLTGREHVLGHPPFFVSTLKVWAQVWGYHPLSARLFSVIAGTCTIPLLYLLSKKLFDKRTSSIAALLFTFSSFHIYYSQELNSYSLLALQVVLAMLFLLRLLDSPSMKTFAAFTLVNIIALHTHLFYLFVLAAHFLVGMLFGNSRKSRLMVLLSLVITGILFIPWASTTLAGDWNSNRDYIQSHPREFSAREFLTYLGDFIGISQTIQNRPPLEWNPPPSFYILIGIPLSITLFLRSRKDGHLRMMLLYFLMPALAYKILETIAGPVSPLGMLSRYLLIIYPAFVILLARGIATFSMPLTAALMLILIIPSCASLYYEYTHVTKEDWRGAAEYIRQNFSAEIAVLVLPQWVDHSPRVYLNTNPGISKGQSSPFTFYLIYEPETFQPEDLPQEIVVVTSTRHLETADKGVLHYLDQEYAVSAKKEFFGGIEVALYTRDHLSGNDNGG